jgi:hypothetical protein
MMRKLAVTVFALSFVAFGCGSDSDTTTPDAGKTIDSSAANKDVGVGPEVQVTVDSAVDVASPDGAIDQAPQIIDAGIDSTGGTTSDVAIDVGQTGAEVGIDGLKTTTVDGGIDGGIDGSVGHVDGGIDTGAVIDTGAAIDTGALDTGATG